ncbi:alpha/beta hydrolase [Streptomyces sp. NPDC006624]|uniref:alpha/beta hydrolase n=1 Tax=Streptomyces sp. NPDC006624 TaxID=3154892 RepID=UPI0033B2EC69
MRAGKGSAAEESPLGRDVSVPAGPVRLTARLALPAAPRGLVAVTMDTGGPTVAAALRHAGLGTVRLDLLTVREAGDRHNLFDVPLLARRLGAACRWLGGETGLPLGCAGGGTAAAAALEAAAADDAIRAVVCFDGRPELARPAALARVRVPVLFVVGEFDTRLLGRTRLAAHWMPGPYEIAELPGAPHAVTGGRNADVAAELARDWFTGHLGGPGATR